jgi:VWFA-related protein
VRARIIRQMTGSAANRADHARQRGAATAALWIIACLLAIAQEPQAPPAVFRAGTNIVRVDATVVDRSGNPVSSLTEADFEIREDGVLQTISSFKFVTADGRTTDDRSLPIRNQSQAASEAERDDVRTFLILWDEYHIGEFVSQFRAREALEKAVLTAFGQTDLVGLMDQLTPMSALEFTRDRRGMADRVRKLQGRRGVYIPRSPLEEEQMRAATSAPGGIEGVRSTVTFDAIKAAATHLRTLGEGRKTLIVLSEGFTPLPQGHDLLAARPAGGARRESDDPAIDLVRTANDSNVAIHIIDPMGLQIGTRPNFFLQTITADTGGELHRNNDLKVPFAKAVRAASAVYLLGYAREPLEDGRFHQIKVSVKPRGLDVRARTGYWAPSAEEITRARADAAAATPPSDVARAFASLTPSGSQRQADIFAGTRPLGDGRMQVTLAWTPRSSGPRNAAARVTVTARANEVVFEGDVRPDGITFDAAVTDLHLAFTVLSQDGEVLDREARTIDASSLADGAVVFGTPVVYRATTGAQIRAMQEVAPAAAIRADREFVRTDRVFVRASLAGASASTATVTARLLDRRGATLVSLPVAPLAAAADTWQLELPLGSLGIGEYAIALDAESGTSRARAVTSFRLRR